MSEWEPIETAPKDGSIVLLSNGHWIQRGYYEDDAWYIVNNGDYHDGGYGNDYECQEPPSGRGLDWFGYSIPNQWLDIPPPTQGDR